MFIFLPEFYVGVHHLVMLLWSINIINRNIDELQNVTIQIKDYKILVNWIFLKSHMSLGWAFPNSLLCKQHFTRLGDKNSFLNHLLKTSWRLQVAAFAGVNISRNYMNLFHDKITNISHISPMYSIRLTWSQHCDFSIILHMKSVKLAYVPGQCKICEAP